MLNWKNILVSLPIVSDEIFSKYVNTKPQLKKADLKEIENRENMEGKPIKEIFSPVCLEEAIKNIEKFKMLYEELKSKDWVGNISFTELKKENDSAGAYIFLGINPKYDSLSLGNVFLSSTVHKIGEDEFYVH